MPRTQSISVPATAERANEDAVQAGERIVVVVDGAGLPAFMRAGCVHSVQWFAQSIAGAFYRRLTAETGSMADALASTIEEVANAHGSQCDLAAGSPSATVAAWRLSGQQLEYLVLADASLVLLDSAGRSHTFTDDRLQQAAARFGVPSALNEVSPALDGDAVRAARRDLLEQTRNRPGGFWCVQDDPDAAQHAVTGSASVGDLQSVIVLSDGASRGYDLLDVLTVPELTARVIDGELQAVADAVRRGEDDHARELGQLGMKVHDDLTIVVTRLWEDGVPAVKERV